MNFSALSSFSGTMLWLYGAAGIIFILLGLLLSRLPSKRSTNSTDLAALRSDAQYWHIPEAALTDFLSSSKHFPSSCAVGAGLGSLLFTVVYALVLMSPAWNLICPFSIGSFINNVWFLMCIIGGSGGGLYALHHLRRKARLMRNGGPQRSLGDYRSPLFYLIPGVWFVLFCTLVLAVHPSYLPLNDCLGSDFPSRPWQGGIVYPWLIFAFVALLSTEWLLSRIASARSPLVPTNVSDADAIDDMFRGKLIAIMQYLIIFQILMFSASFPAVVTFPYSLIGTFLPYLGFFAVLSLLLSSKGLGGKLTGWFWKRKHIA